MRKNILTLISFIAALAMLLSACSDGGAVSETPPLSSGADGNSVMTPPPDYSTMDFSGNWYVSQLLTSSGTALSADEMKVKGADFILELHASWDYFVYGADGAVLGQGRYSVNADKLILSAGNVTTEYSIIDASTLKSTAADGSVTVMSKEADIPGEDDEGEPDATGDNAETPDETAPDVTSSAGPGVTP